MAQASSIVNSGDDEIHNSRRERLKQLRSQCATDLAYEIEISQEHWTEVDTATCIDDQELETANREVFERLKVKWRNRRTKLCFFHDWGESLKVGKKIAEGGQAEIFEAELENDPGIEKYVVKVFKKGYSLSDLARQWPLGMFRRQPLASSYASIVSSSPPGASRRPVRRLRPPVSTHFIHDNCCFIHGGTLLKNGRFAFVLERYWGDLRRVIDVRMEAGYHKPFPAMGASIKIMLDIAQGMWKLHSRGILHRDLKASNILIGSTNGKLDALGKFYLGDIRNYVVDVADFESSSGVMGTGLWRAPEVLSALKDHTLKLDSKTWTEKSDVYAYAMTCYEVLTGRLPFEGIDGINNDSVINGTRPLWFGNEHYDLRQLVMKCWHSDPLERPNFGDIRKTLSRLAYLQELHPIQEILCPPSPKFHVRNRAEKLEQHVMSCFGRGSGTWKDQMT